MAKTTKNGKAPKVIRHIGDLKPDGRNARSHSPRNIGVISNALQEVGAGRSILIDAGGGIIAGNGVVEAAALVGIERVRVVESDGNEIIAVRRSDLKGKRRTRAALLDNAPNAPEANPEYWDAQVIGELAASERALLDGVLRDNELAALFNGAGGATTNDADARADKAAELQEKWGVERGDLWTVGQHRLFCDDCTVRENVAQAMGGEKVSMMFSDPPYCSGGFQESGKAAGSWGEIASDNLSTRGYIALITKSLAAAQPQAAYLFTDWRMWIPLYDLVESSGLAVRSMIVWDKGTPGLGALWRTQHELVMFASRSGGKRIKGIPAIGNVLSVQRSGNTNHYTEKPVELLQRIIDNDAASARGKCVIYDGFVGSGSTMIAGENLGRPVYGIEVEPVVCAVVLQRMADAFPGIPIELTNGKAKRKR